MTDIPILFSAPMVRALLEGRKTMTRRLACREPTDKEAGDEVKRILDESREVQSSGIPG